MLEIEQLGKTYHKGAVTITPLRDLALTVRAGEFVAVHGPSGCGKTTLLLIAGGLLHPDAGTVRVDGQDLYRLSAEARAAFRAAHIGFVFQQFHLIPYLTVLENVLAPAVAVPVPEPSKRALDLLEQFGLGHRVRHLPAELSTGERQRTALARALLHRPKLLLADEPTGNLDEDNGRIVLGYLADYARQGGAVLLVTHDRRAAELAHRRLALGGSSEAIMEKV
jgi:ABC-type lipoprotein export system ATPase subunit